MLLMTLALIMLTQLDGSPVWVESTQVQIVKLGARECGHNAKSVVRVLSTTLCVKESTDEVRSKIREAK